MTVVQLFNDDDLTPFDRIRKLDPSGNESWSARDLQDTLGYVEWRKFEALIDIVKANFETQSGTAFDNVVAVDKVVERENRGSIEIRDYHLSRLACYLIAMEGDGRKPEIAAAKKYFAHKTREAEVRPQLDLDSFSPAELRAALIKAEVKEEVTKQVKPIEESQAVLETKVHDVKAKVDALIEAKATEVPKVKRNRTTYQYRINGNPPDGYFAAVEVYEGFPEDAKRVSIRGSAISEKKHISHYYCWGKVYLSYAIFMEAQKELLKEGAIKF